MTKQAATIDVSAMTTDAKFRNWGSTCSTLIQASGLVKTSDTGQVDWTTVTRPVAASVKAGYEIYRFNDSLQSTKPIYIRIDFGSNPQASGTGIQTWLTVGTGTNGAGTITGATIGPTAGQSLGNTSTNSSMPVHFTHSLANGYALLNFGLEAVAGGGTSAGVGTFIIERTKDSSGSPTGDGVGVISTHYVSALFIRTYSINFNTSTPFPTARPAVCGATSTAVSLSTGTTLAFYRHYIACGGMFNAVGAVSYWLGDVSAGSAFAVTPVGSTPHTYYAYGVANLAGADSSASANIYLAWMWED